MLLGEIMRTTEQILAEARAIEAARAAEAPAVVIPDPLTQYRDDAEASLAADHEELQRRQRKAAHEQRQRAAMSADAVCNLVVEIVTPIIANLQKQISELEKRCRLSEDRAKSLEERCMRSEERLARAEERQLGPVDRPAMSSHSSKTH
jgi:hypothetical protein